eukprot:1138957-Pelagomonas_calceolata.AAC.4
MPFASLSWRRLVCGDWVDWSKAGGWAAIGGVGGQWRARARTRLQTGREVRGCCCGWHLGAAQEHWREYVCAAMLLHLVAALLVAAGAGDAGTSAAAAAAAAEEVELQPSVPAWPARAPACSPHCPPCPASLLPAPSADPPGRPPSRLQGAARPTVQCPTAVAHAVRQSNVHLPWVSALPLVERWHAVRHSNVHPPWVGTPLPLVERWRGLLGRRTGLGVGAPPHIFVCCHAAFLVVPAQAWPALRAGAAHAPEGLQRHSAVQM